MWHASVSLQARGVMLHQPRRAEAIAIDALRGVGGTSEWWYWNNAARVGHLRVPITRAEALLVPDGVVTMDAGEAGRQRRRSP